MLLLELFNCLVKNVFISKVKFNSLFIIVYFYISNDLFVLNMQQSLLLLIWMLAYVIHTFHKSKLDYINL